MAPSFRRRPMITQACGGHAPCAERGSRIACIAAMPRLRRKKATSGSRQDDRLCSPFHAMWCSGREHQGNMLDRNTFEKQRKSSVALTRTVLACMLTLSLLAGAQGQAPKCSYKIGRRTHCLCFCLDDTPFSDAPPSHDDDCVSAYNGAYTPDTQFP